MTRQQRSVVVITHVFHSATDVTVCLIVYRNMMRETVINQALVNNGGMLDIDKMECSKYVSKIFKIV